MSLKVDIKKKFKGFNLHVSFETNNEYLGLLGASGCGKSLTLKCIAGVETPDEGRIVLRDRVLFDSKKNINLKPQERNVGYMFQNFALFPNMTVEENIGAGLKAYKKEKKEIVDDMIKLFHLQGLEKKYPGQMSGGQQQRTALARCIAYKPDVLLLDEPFSALDTHLKSQVQAEMLELLKLYHGNVLMVSHSMEEAYKFCKNLVIIEEGNSVLFGETKEIFKNPELASVARLIGCKNISSCSLLSPNKIYAHDWDIEIDLNKTVSDIGFVGIQSNNFEIVEKMDVNDTNIIECNIIDKIEKIQGYTIIFKNKKSSNITNHMYFDIKKEKWNNRKNIDNLYLRIPVDKILLLK